MLSAPNHFSPLSSQLQHEWLGLDSQKFRAAERVHFTPKDMLKTVEGVDLPFLGRKHFTPTYGTVKHEKLGLKVFPTIQNRQTDLTDLKSLQKLAYVPAQKKVSSKLQTSSQFFKTEKNRSLIMPSTFVNMKSMRVTSSIKQDINGYTVKEDFFRPQEEQTGPKTQKFVMKTFGNNTYMPAWKEKEIRQERFDEVNSVKDLARWEKINAVDNVSRIRIIGDLGNSPRQDDAKKFAPTNGYQVKKIRIA